MPTLHSNNIATTAGRGFAKRFLGMMFKDTRLGLGDATIVAVLWCFFATHQAVHRLNFGVYLHPYEPNLDTISGIYWLAETLWKTNRFGLGIWLLHPLLVGTYLLGAVGRLRACLIASLSLVGLAILLTHLQFADACADGGVDFSACPSVPLVGWYVWLGGFLYFGLRCAWLTWGSGVPSAPCADRHG